MKNNEILESLSQLAKWANSDNDLDAVKKCLDIFKMEHRKNSQLFRMCEETEGIIYQRELDLMQFYSENKSNY